MVIDTHNLKVGVLYKEVEGLLISFFKLNLKKKIFNCYHNIHLQLYSAENAKQSDSK